MCRFKFNSAHIFDSAAAYFGSDNVGLCGIALVLQGVWLHLLERFGLLYMCNVALCVVIGGTMYCDWYITSPCDGLSCHPV